MDLRNLSSTPSQLDIQRRPSLSSLSSTSGYASSSFGANAGPGTPGNANNGVSGPVSTTAAPAGGGGKQQPPPVATQNGAKALNGINPSTVSNAWFSGTNPVNDVTPWVEQQKQQQSNVGSLDFKEKEKEKEKAKRGGGSATAATTATANTATTTGGNNTPITAAAVVAAAAGVSSSPSPGNSISGHQDFNGNQKSSGPKPNASANSKNGATSSTNPGSNKPSGKRNNDSSDDADDDNDNDDIDDDELIPTAIVIKNIPFAIKKEQLLDVMTKLSLPLPYAFNYHFDNGVFRGLAFANFTSTDETSTVVNQLNGREIGGRKLRVEYKKMLPAQERERIEREKREKRGQLEEQHRSTSNASLASLMSATSTTAATKNLSVNGINQQQSQERMFLNFPSPANFNLPTNLPPDLNFNDLETLELFSQLIVFKDDNFQKTLELAYPPNLSLPQRKLLLNLCAYLNLLELYDNGLIIIRRKPGQFFLALNPINNPANPNAAGGNLNLNLNAPVGTSSGSMGANFGGLGGLNGSGSLAGFSGLTEGPHSSTSMMNLNQLSTSINTINNPLHTPTHPELLRSHSQSALPLPRMRQQQSSTPVQQSYPQYANGSNLVTPHNHGHANGANGSHSHSNSQTHPVHPHGPHGHPHVNGKPLYQGMQPFAFMPQNQQALPNQLNPNLNPSTSAAAILRNGSNSSRPYGDIRSTPPLANSFTTAESPTPTPLHTHSNLFGGASSATSTPTATTVAPVAATESTVADNGTSTGAAASTSTEATAPNSANSQSSQPSTPLQSNDINSRFAPFGQHSQLAGSLSSLPASTNAPRHSDEFNQDLTGKFNSFNLNYDAGSNAASTKGSGIWGPK